MIQQIIRYTTNNNRCVLIRNCTWQTHTVMIYDVKIREQTKSWFFCLKLEKTKSIFFTFKVLVWHTNKFHNTNFAFSLWMYWIPNFRVLYYIFKVLAYANIKTSMSKGKEYAYGKFWNLCMYPNFVIRQSVVYYAFILSNSH